MSQTDDKFKSWLLDKDIREKAIQLLAKLDNNRASELSTLKEVGISLYAIDKLLGNDTTSSNATNANNGENMDEFLDSNAKPHDSTNTNTNTTKKKTMKQIWIKWVMEYHSFNHVKLNENDYNQFSSGIQEFMDKEKDDRSTDHNNNNNTNNIWIYILPSLKYTFPTIPTKPNEKMKPLSNDQKLQNKIFIKCALSLWKKIGKELEQLLSEKLDKMIASNIEKLSSFSESKSADYSMDPTSNININNSNSNNGTNTTNKYTTQILYEIGIKQLKIWVEEDEDRAYEQQRQDKDEKLREARIMHEQFVKKKDSLRIRMPEGIAHTKPTPPPMSYGKEIYTNKIKIKGSPALTTVELMAGSGLKYVHAISRGQQGLEGDLEKSKKELIRKGLLTKENFDSDDPDSEFYKEKYYKYIEDHPLIHEKEEYQKKLNEENNRAYQSWVQLKDLRHTAIKYLQHIPILDMPMSAGPNVISSSSSSASRKGSTVIRQSFQDDMNQSLQKIPRKFSTENRNNTPMRLSRSNSLRQSGTSRLSIPDDLQSMTSTLGRSSSAAGGGTTMSLSKIRYCMKIGQALKRIDRTLFQEWYNWCNQSYNKSLSSPATNATTSSSSSSSSASIGNNCDNIGRISAQLALTAWDYFEPQSCDIHSSAYSQIRDAFIKLLKPGYDYQQHFLQYVEKTYKRKLDIPSIIPNSEVKRKLFSEISITKKQMNELLIQMGITMKSSDLIFLIDSFDSDNNGYITLQEFMDYIGYKRETNSGISMILNQKCIWLTTCMETGMPNAYSVSVPPTKSIHKVTTKAEEKSSARLSAESKTLVNTNQIRESLNSESNKLNNTSNIMLKTLKNGETRYCVESQERKIRLNILRKYGLLENKSTELRTTQKAESKVNHDYDDEFEEYGGDNSHQSHTESKNNDSNKFNCQSSSSGGSSGNKMCAYVKWSLDDRKQALKILEKESELMRQENYIQTRMTSGQPPSIPLLWTSEPVIDNSYVNTDDDDDDDDDDEQEEDYRDDDNNNYEDDDEEDDDDFMGTGYGSSSNTNSRQNSGKQGKKIPLSSQQSQQEYNTKEKHESKENDYRLEKPSTNKKQSSFSTTTTTTTNKRAAIHNNKMKKKTKKKNDNISTQLLLNWSTSMKNDLISFFSIEFGGPANGVLRSEKYQELLRDPKDASPNSKFIYTYKMLHLQPSTSYCFRARAYNGYGPSDYVYKVFTTLCDQPSTPKVIGTSSTTIEIQWLFTEDYTRFYNILHELFLTADADQSGVVSRKELQSLLSQKCKESNELHDFLQLVSSKLGLESKTGYDSLFDMIEGDDDNNLTWEEFHLFFMNSGWFHSSTHMKKVAGMNSSGSMEKVETPHTSRQNTPTRGGNSMTLQNTTTTTTIGKSNISVNRSMTMTTPRGYNSLSSTPRRSATPTRNQLNNSYNNNPFNAPQMTTTTTSTTVNDRKPLTNTLKPASNNSTTAPTNKNITYIVEQCESEIDQVYKEVLKTSSGSGVIARLDPGKSYRFRVYGINCDGRRGPYSDTVVAHTMLETPNPPSIYTPTGIQTTKLLIKWDNRNQYISTRNQKAVDKLMTEWAGLYHIKESGVSVETAFMKYDRDHNGTIDKSEFIYLLSDLGISNVTDEKINDAMKEFDSNNDGVITFDEFATWWRSSDVIYTIKRSYPILPMYPIVYDQSSSSMMNTARSTANGQQTQQTVRTSLSRHESFSKESHEKMKHESKLDDNHNYDDDDDDDDIFKHLDVLTMKEKGSVHVPTLKVVDKPPRYTDVTMNMTKLLTTQITASKLFIPKSVATPIVSYRGEKTKCEISGLLPNRLYHIKLRYIGTRSSSMLSIPLEIMTCPLPIPQEPVLVAMTSTTIRIKWYPNDYGTYKYEAHLRKSNSLLMTNMTLLNDSILNTNTTMNSTMNTTTTTNAGSSGSNWSVVFQGQENIYVNTTMAPDTTYEFRVYCLNYQGVYSESSPILSFTTPPRQQSTTNMTTTSNNTIDPNTSMNMSYLNNSSILNNTNFLFSKKSHSLYTIECTGDITIGDTILITERIYATKASVSTLNTARSTSSARSMTQESIRRENIKPKNHTHRMSSNSNMNNSTLTDMNASTMSAGVYTDSNGTCIGERTIAAHVTKDNYRTLRDLSPTTMLLRQSCTPLLTQNDTNNTKEIKSDDNHLPVTTLPLTKIDCQQFSRNRIFWLEVLWHKTNLTSQMSENLSILEIKPGTIIQRRQMDIEQFEIYRCSWLQEYKRMSLWYEWTALSECYISLDPNNTTTDK